MLPVESVIAFVFASVLLALAPGPDNIFVLAQSALYGRKAGLFVTLGLSTGLVFHTTAVALGVAVIFQNSALAFNLLKIAGAVYLLYLAWGAFRAPAEDLAEGGVEPASNRALYTRGIIMNITNPKVSLFFLAFLPQFASAETGPLAPQIFQLGALFIVATLIVFGSIALLAGQLGSWLKSSPGVQLGLNRTAGVVFVGLALNLLASSARQAT